MHHTMPPSARCWRRWAWSPPTPRPARRGSLRSASLNSSALRLAGSLKLGRVPAAGIMRTLQVGDRPTRLAQAIAERDGRIAQAIVSINAFKGVSFGAGFDGTDRRGSKVHDVILPREQWEHQQVNDGDQILLFQVIAGG